VNVFGDYHLKIKEAKKTKIDSESPFEIFRRYMLNIPAASSWNPWKTIAAILDDGQIKLQELHLEDFGLEMVDKKLVRSAETMKENLVIALDVLHGKRETQEQCARMDLCLANTGAMLFLAGKVDILKDGVLMANAIERGLATQKMEEFIRKISNNS